MIQTDADLEGATIRTPTRVARIVVASRLLDIALVDFLDPQGRPTGEQATCRVSNLKSNGEN